MTAGIATPAPVGAERGRFGFGWKLVPVAVAGATFAVAAATAGSPSLSSDEAIAVSRAQQPLGELLSTIVHDEPAQAGHLLLLKAAAAIGTDEWTVRLVSAAAVALAAGLLTILAGAALGRMGGIVAGIALATNAGVVEAGRQVGPVALGVLGVVVATLAFTAARRGGQRWRWMLYALSCAALPFTHPLAIACVGAHLVDLAVHRGRAGSRLAIVATSAGLLPALVGLAWMARDRLDAPEETERLRLIDVGEGLAHAIGWNPLLALAAVAGLVVMLARPTPRTGVREVVLAVGLVTAPVAALLLGALATTVHPTTALVLCAPGIALAAGGVTGIAADRRTAWIGAAALAASSLVAVGVLLTTREAEDWRALAAAVKRVRGPRETVVVLPDSSRAAFAYYAPYVPTLQHARGDGAWVAVAAGGPEQAIALARESVRTPTYALRRQFRYGDGLRLQHWVRP